MKGVQHLKYWLKKCLIACKLHLLAKALRSFPLCFLFLMSLISCCFSSLYCFLNWNENLKKKTFSFIYLFIYLAGCSMFLHLPAPIWQLSYLFFHLSLSFQSSSINPFSPNSPLIPSAQVALGLPRFLLPGGLHFITFFGSLPSSILWTCPYHFSCLVLISSKRDLVALIFCLIIVFLILSLKIWADRHQKSISVEFSFDTDFAFKHHVSAAFSCINWL